MIHHCFYFGSYTVVIHSLWFLHRYHTFTSGSYTITHFDSHAVSFYGSYVVYHFILRFLHCLSFHFMVLTPFIISFYDSYTVCHLVYDSYIVIIAFGSYTTVTTLGSYINFLANYELFSIGSYTDDG